jgi:NAD(P)H dehydrogenase (quinone)
MNNHTFKVLVTGASGKTGKSIIQALTSKGFPVRAFVRHAEKMELIGETGSIEVFVGNIESETDLLRSLEGMDGVYHICPNMYPNELLTGKALIESCQTAGVKRFVYHSVLHPQIQKMNHHWQKLLVEEALFESKLDYTILQPTVYMQNILGYKNSIEKGIYPLPYPGTSRLSMVDLQDIAEVAANIFSDTSSIGGIYELVGTNAITQFEVVDQLSKITGKTIEFNEIPLGEWEQTVRKGTLSEYAIVTLKSMFEYYGLFGLWGSPKALTNLLGRKPTTLEQFLEREF